MRILVTGGAGFIGSHVVDLLLKQGHEVCVVFDKTKPGKIKHVEKKVSFVHGDIRNLEDCMIAVKDVEAVIHLAALINVDHSIDEPTAFYETNVQGTQNLLEAVRLEPSVKKLVYMSTCEVYGNVPTGKVNEEALCIPRSPYASSKYAAERYCLCYHYTYGDPEIAILRGFNVFGPRQSYGVRGAVIAIFITNTLNQKPFYINGDGSQSRDYIYVKDIARGIVKAALTSGLDGEIINLACGQPRTIREIAYNILMLTESDLKPIYRKSRPGELMRSCGDAQKALKLLNWRPEGTFLNHLKETIAHYRKHGKKL